MKKYERPPDVSIIVPYRNRPNQLNTWEKLVGGRLQESAEILIVEQTDDLPFNRGCLLNIGFRYSRGHRVIFHDVDLVPNDDLLNQYCSPWPKSVVHFGSRFSRYNNTDRYFGGVTGFFRRDFPGFPNRFWGWGGEDDVLFNRTYSAIHRPRSGHYTDLEFLPTVKHKLNTLRRVDKCLNRWELKASDHCRTDNHVTIPESVRFAHRLHMKTSFRKIIHVLFY